MSHALAIARRTLILGIQVGSLCFSRNKQLAKMALTFSSDEAITKYLIGPVSSVGVWVSGEFGAEESQLNGTH